MFYNVNGCLGGMTREFVIFNVEMSILLFLLLYIRFLFEILNFFLLQEVSNQNKKKGRPIFYKMY